MSILEKIRTWLNKDEEGPSDRLPENGNGSFTLSVDGIEIGYLTCKEGTWEFRYADGFKELTHEYHHIVGFSDLNRVYRSQTLWPFFAIRIPGLKQPAVQEVLKNESIAPNNEVDLLKRFGRKSIANPYELVYAHG